MSLYIFGYQHDDQLLDLAFMTNYSQSTFTWLVVSICIDSILSGSFNTCVLSVVEEKSIRIKLISRDAQSDADGCLIG